MTQNKTKQLSLVSTKKKEIEVENHHTTPLPGYLQTIGDVPLSKLFPFSPPVVKEKVGQDAFFVGSGKRTEELALKRLHHCDEKPLKAAYNSLRLMHEGASETLTDKIFRVTNFIRYLIDLSNDQETYQSIFNFLLITKIGGCNV